MIEVLSGILVKLGYISFKIDESCPRSESLDVRNLRSQTLISYIIDVCEISAIWLYKTTSLYLESTGC